MKHDAGWLLFLPLCPSTNRRMQPVVVNGHARDILTKEAREYKSSVGMALNYWRKSFNYKPISRYRYVDLWFILPRTNCDVHNYGKVLFDALQEGGIVADDKYILPRVMGVWHSRETQAIVAI